MTQALHVPHEKPSTHTRQSKMPIAPILNEIQLLHETVHSDYKKLHIDYAELKESITQKSSDVAENLTWR